MTTMPRVPCPHCRRPIAAGPVAGRPTLGRLWRHDEPGMHREYAGALISCPGSLDLVPLPGARQLELLNLDDEQDQEQNDAGDTLF